ncbi:hypothetical protein BO78DRAFT_417167 [Aspergillus sclerotiicarbonarius CBS 121057]|uniref:Uncharacterized protein n=1 Tax=Aspergillus sclerotiicarbonarius (strain CBS 121057 / IBT 28362) TaxID=1448318 RepID=A0A319ECF8_ASPSB|nr:hypothetical protein BO78DRAFT_417167 [Aspergillus sclerotiicarbonarius CBS 121057]
MTVTDCAVGCSITNYGDTSRATTCFTTQCSTITGCETKGSTTTTDTITNLCPTTIDVGPAANWDPNGPPPTLGSDNKYTASGEGQTTEPSTTEPSTTEPSTTTSTSTSSQSSQTTSIPLLTSSNSNKPTYYCFKDHHDSSYASFDSTGLDSAASSLCGSGNSLAPGGPPYTYVYSDPYGANVIASLQWADDQSGCKTEKTYKLVKKTGLATFEKISSGCGEGTAGKYGGGFIAQTDGGCMEWMIYGQAVKSECSCNEDGCTDDSPACCANGTCGSSQEVSVAKVKLIAPSEVM